MSIQEINHSVKCIGNGLVSLSFELPAGAVDGFLVALSSMATLLKDVQHQTQVAVASAPDSDKRRIAKLNYSRYENEVCRVFDSMVAAGVSTSEVISQTNFVVKQQFVNSTYDLVRKTLIKTGRLKKIGYYKKS